MTDSSTHTDLFTVLQKQRLKLRKPGEASEKEKTKENPSHLFSKSVLNCFLSSVYDWEKRFHQDNQSKCLYFFKSVKHFYRQDQVFLFIVKKKWSWETFFFCSLVVNTGEKTICVRPWNRSPDIFSLTCQGFRMKRMILDVLWQCSWAMLARQEQMQRRGWCLSGTHGL